MPFRRLNTEKRLTNLLKVKFNLEQYSKCVICMAEYEEPCQVSFIACSAYVQGHGFHTECLEAWIKAAKG